MKNINFHLLTILLAILIPNILQAAYDSDDDEIYHQVANGKRSEKSGQEVIWNKYRESSRMLMKGAKAGDIREINNAIGMWLNNIKNKRQNSPLGEAIIHGKRDAIEFLLQHNASPQIKCSMEQTPLQIAISNGDEESAVQLLQYGAHSAQALFSAVNDNNTKMVSIILEYDAKLNKGQVAKALTNSNNANLLLRHVTATNNDDITQILLKYGAKPTNEQVSKILEFLDKEKNWKIFKLFAQFFPETVMFYLSSKKQANNINIIIPEQFAIQYMELEQLAFLALQKRFTNNNQ